MWRQKLLAGFACCALCLVSPLVSQDAGSVLPSLDLISATAQSPTVDELLTTLDSLLGQLSTKVTLSQADLAKLRADLAAAREQLATLSKQLQDSQTETQGLRDSLTRADSRLTDCEKLLSKAEARYKALELERDAWRTGAIIAAVIATLAAVFGQ